MMLIASHEDNPKLREGWEINSSLDGHAYVVAIERRVPFSTIAA
jgi:hypothetical protein